MVLFFVFFCCKYLLGIEAWLVWAITVVVLVMFELVDIYIYIYRERERERGREIIAVITRCTILIHISIFSHFLWNLEQHS